MKKIILTILTVAFVSMAFQTIAQDELKYRRSSLNMILIESESFPKKDVVVQAYNKHPFPDKYNEHKLDDRKFEIGKVKLTDADKVAAGFYADTLKTKIKIAAAEAKKQTIRYIDEAKTMAVVEPKERKLVSAKISKFIKEKQIAKQMVATWFNRTPDGKLDYQLIIERGNYSASEAVKEEAKSVAMATDFLFDMDLLGNTFVVFNRLKFVENEPIAAIAREMVKLAAAKALEGKPPLLLDKANKAADLAYEKAKEGYSVWTTSWLYQLEWNENIATKFKSYFLNKSMDGKAIWDTTNLFVMKYVGSKKAQSVVTFSLKEKRTEEEIVTLAVDRNIDKVFAKLQKTYVVFRPVTPVYTVGPVTAQIGLKEGLKPGQTYEILEARLDPKYNTLKYVSVGKVKVDKKSPIWDNRMGAELEKVLDEAGVEIPKGETPKYSTFTGGKKVEMNTHYLRLLK